MDALATVDPEMADDLRIAYCEVYKEVMADNPYPTLDQVTREKKWMEETQRLINEYILVKREFYQKALAEKVDSVGLLLIEAEIDNECERRGIRRLRPMDEYYKRERIRVKAAYQNRK